jgi:hypothetical protein
MSIGLHIGVFIGWTKSVHNWKECRYKIICTQALNQTSIQPTDRSTKPHNHNIIEMSTQESASEQRVFAVAGGVGGGEFPSASLGNYVVKALLAKGNEVRVLARSHSLDSPAAKHLAANGAKVIAVDYGSQSDLDEALKGVHVVVSALNPSAVQAQHELADASKRCGVELLLPA